MYGIISNIQRFSMHDGPGIRSTVFFKGCPLRCLWCHNPETYAFGQEPSYNRTKCIGCSSCIAACAAQALFAEQDGLHYAREKCRRCFACANACPAQALTCAGRQMRVEEVLQEVLPDRGLYQRTGGGVTLSGGEATAQPDFALALLRALKAEGVHTALDTCGQCPPDRFEALTQAADLVLLDIKHADSARHRELTGVGNEQILANLDLLERGTTPVEVRIPVVPTLNADDENFARTAALLKDKACVRSIVLLGYHTLGQSKIYAFDQNGRDLHIVPPTRAFLAEAAARMQEVTQKPTTYR